MDRFSSSRGQLLLPMLGVLVLFSLLFVGYVELCRRIYWQMRMDLAADAVALSAARAQAGMLNDLSVAQTAENFFIQKARIVGVDIAHMQIEIQKPFEVANWLINKEVKGFNGQTVAVAQAVARANGVQGTAVPWPKPGHHLTPHAVYVVYFDGPIPVSVEHYPKVYYTRNWSPGKSWPQPDHQIAWAVSRGQAVGISSARVWLDLDRGRELHNGGFPSEADAWWKEIGIQGFYPHFNAKLVSTSAEAEAALRLLLGGTV
jgi:Flp pilus assembly protein TadG